MKNPPPELEGYSNLVEVERDDFSVTYHALQNAVGRTVAIKTFGRGPADGTSQRWERERAALGRLSAHPNILSVFGSGTLRDGRPFIVMDASTTSLASRVSEGKLAAEWVTGIGVMLAGALESAHEAGVLHRDISPLNVVLSPFDQPMLAGFGIADVAGISAGRTRTISTADWYVAPEVLSGSRTTIASDLYSLGSVLYTALVGQAAHPRRRGRSMVEEIVRIQTTPVVQPEGANIPDPIWTVIATAMALEPADRYATAAQFGAALQRAGRELGYSVPPMRVSSIDESSDSGGGLDGGSAWTEFIDRPERKPPAPTKHEERRLRLTAVRIPLAIAAITLLTVAFVLAIARLPDDPSSTPTESSTTVTVVEDGGDDDGAGDENAPITTGYEIAVGGTLLITSPDGSPPRAIAAAARPSNGTIVPRPEIAALQYLADGGFFGTDTFSYSLCIVEECSEHAVTVTVREATQREVKLIAGVNSTDGVESCRTTDPKTVMSTASAPLPDSAVVCLVDGAEVTLAQWDTAEGGAEAVQSFWTAFSNGHGEPDEWHLDGDSTGFAGEMPYPAGKLRIVWSIASDSSSARRAVLATAALVDPSDDPRADSDALQSWWDDHKSLVVVVAQLHPDTIGVFDRVTATWALRRVDGTMLNFKFGDELDQPVVGDWDCDGIDTPGVFRPADTTVYLRNSNSAGSAHRWFLVGEPGDIPIGGDFDGDGCDSVSLYRPSTQEFFIFFDLGRSGSKLGAPDVTFRFGDPGDQPVGGDWDGDGTDTVGVYRSSSQTLSWSSQLSTGVASQQTDLGSTGDVALAGDWDGFDGIDTPAVYRPRINTFFFDDPLPSGRSQISWWVTTTARAVPLSGVFE